MKKYLIPSTIFLGSTLIALYNVGGFPKMVGDEGIYVSQAYWLSHFGRLGPYTYWYDHFPLGWAQIGVWQLLVGPIRFLGSSVLSARVFIGLVLAGSSTLLYVISKKLTSSHLFGFLASMFFMTSTLTLTFGRMVLLDNLAVFWFLTSLLILLSKPTNLRHLTLSAITLAIGILTKESLLFFLPPYIYLVYYLNQTNIHKRYALTINHLTVFFFLSFFPLLAILKSELLPHVNQVSFLETILFQAQRGLSLPFWKEGSHLRQMLQVWLQIDPILPILGGISTLAILISKTLTLYKIISSFTVFFIIFLARGGQIYDFYLIPVLPLLACNTVILLHKFSQQFKFKLIPYLFVLSNVIYFISTSLYPFTATATEQQLKAIGALNNISTPYHVTTNNYAHLDVWLNSHSIDWYSKIESDPPVQKSYEQDPNQKYFLVDETIAREIANGDLPYIKSKVLQSRQIATYGRLLGPGELSTIKPYTNDYLILYKYDNGTNQPSQLITVNNISKDTLDLLKSPSPYGVIITKDNFTNSVDLQTKLTLIKELLPQTLIFTSQDSEGDNVIPWISTPSRSFYKSIQEARDGTLKKSMALKDLGFDGAVIASSQDQDNYLSEIISASDSVFTTLVRFNGSIPKVPTNLVVSREEDVAKITQSNYQGKVLFLLP